MSYLIAWEFQVRPEACSQFEQVYGPEGEWAQLFRRSEGYMGTELLRDCERDGRYLVLDCWRSAELYKSFRHTHAEEYSRLDRRCEALTVRESPIGTFTTLD